MNRSLEARWLAVKIEALGVAAMGSAGIGVYCAYLLLAQAIGRQLFGQAQIIVMSGFALVAISSFVYMIHKISLIFLKAKYPDRFRERWKITGKSLGK